MKPLVVFLLRLVLQLLLFAITGRWYELGQPSQAAPRASPKKQAGTRRDRTFRPESKTTRARAARMHGVQPDFATEGTYRDPESSVLEGGAGRARGVRTARMVSRPAPATSLRAALTDRRVLRDALILDAALGARGRKR